MSHMEGPETANEKSRPQRSPQTRAKPFKARYTARLVSLLFTIIPMTTCSILIEIQHQGQACPAHKNLLPGNRHDGMPPTQERELGIYGSIGLFLEETNLLLQQQSTRKRHHPDSFRVALVVTATRNVNISNGDIK